MMIYVTWICSQRALKFQSTYTTHDGYLRAEVAAPSAAKGREHTENAQPHTECSSDSAPTFLHEQSLFFWLEQNPD